jgi:hypothetical protein
MKVAFVAWALLVFGFIAFMGFSIHAHQAFIDACVGSRAPASECVARWQIESLSNPFAKWEDVKR